MWIGHLVVYGSVTLFWLLSYMRTEGVSKAYYYVWHYGGYVGIGISSWVVIAMIIYGFKEAEYLDLL